MNAVINKTCRLWLLMGKYKILCGYKQQPPLAYKLGIIGFLLGCRNTMLNMEKETISSEWGLLKWTAILQDSKRAKLLLPAALESCGNYGGKVCTNMTMCKAKQFLVQWRARKWSIRSSSFYFSVKETLAKSRIWSPTNNFMVQVFGDWQNARDPPWQTSTNNAGLMLP